MKRIFKVIFLSFLCVVAALGLLVGGMYLFGGFNEKDVYADNLSFSVSEVVSNEPFALKITTQTENVNKKNLKLSVLAGGESVIDFPTQVEIDEIFTVIPKQTLGNNFGGNVTLVATYDYENSNQSVKAYCEIMIDVAVNSMQIKTEPFTTTLNQKILFAGKDTKVSDVFGINPEKALMPYVAYGTQKVSTIADKKLYLQLVYENVENVVLEKNVARFLIDEVPQEKEYIEVEYSYRDADGDGSKEVVFDKNITIETFEQEDVTLKAYLYSTYKDQNNNIFEEVVQLNKSAMVGAELDFSIGDYQITDMTIIEEDREVYINEDSYIYINNPNATGNDINLGAQLTTDSGTPASDFRLLNTYIKIDNDKYRLLSNNEGSSDTEDGWLSINYADISKLGKNEWRWKLNINNFLAYQNGTPLRATVRYYQYDEITNKTTLIEKSFNIIPKIYEAEQVSVVYPEGKSTFDIKSGSVLNLNANNFEITASIDGTTPTFTNLAYYLSYSENYEGGKTTISTVPSAKNTYKVTFDFVLQNITNERYEISLDRNASRWCEINEAKFTQKSTVDKVYFVDYKNNINNYGENSFEPNKTISVEAVISLTSQPTEDEIFTINSTYAGSNIENCAITNFMAKFYELVDSKNNTYSDIPYLSVDSVRYYVDFDYYLDETTLTKYVRINDELTTTNSYKVQGIGTIYLTAQLVYEDGSATYWLNKSATAKVEIYEELTNISAYEYIQSGETATYNNAFSTEEITENEVDANSDKVYRNIFITSTEFDSLKNYVGYNQVEIYAKQIFSLDEAENNRIINNYSGIEEVNKDAITFGDSWIAVVVNDAIVGYRMSYTINEVYDIEVDEQILQNKFAIEVRVKVNGEYVYASFLINTNLNDKTATANQNYLDVNIKNIVLESAEINYDGVNYGYSEDGLTFAPLSIYADVKDGTNEVYYKTVSGSSEVNFNNLKYFFKYNDTSKANTTETLTATFEAVDENGSNVGIYMNNGGAYYTFEKNADGVGGLVFKNFPRLENGVIVKMTITSQTMLEFNSRYVYDEGNKSFRQTQYNISADFYFRVYGLVVKIEAKDIDLYGALDSKCEFAILGSDTDNNSVFTVAVKSLNPDPKFVGEEKTCRVSNYLDLLNISVDNTDLFEKDANNNLIYDTTGSKLTFATDLIKDEDVVIRFYVGDTLTTKSVISIDVDGKLLPSYTQKVKSPFEVEFVDTFEAPSQNNTFATVLYKTSSFDGLDETALAAAREEAVTKASGKLDLDLEYVNSTLDQSYNITSPITISSNMLLSFKAVPTTDETMPAYKANMLLVLTPKAGGTPREITKTITIMSSILASNIVVGNYVEEIDGEDDNSYYYINAGVEYFVDKAETDENEGIVISGKLNENLANIRDIRLNFADVDYTVDQSINVDAPVHMRSTPYETATKNFSLMSDDLNYQKTVRITFTIDFADGGQVIINKNVVIMPNISMKLSSNVYEEGDNIDLTQSILYNSDGSENYKVLDILSDFDYEDTSYRFNKNSFSFDSKAFKDKSSVSSYGLFVIGVQVGASELTEVERTISFNYVVNNYSQTYILVYQFTLEITDIKTISESDITIGSYVEELGNSYYVLNAGSEISIDDLETPNNEGIVFSKKIMRNIKYLESMDVSFRDVSYEIEENYNVSAATHMSATEYNKELHSLTINCGDLSYKKTVEVIFTLNFSDSIISIKKQLVIMPNISMRLSQTSYKEGDDINLTQSVLYKKSTSNDYQVLDILSDFDYEDTTFSYNKNSFSLDTTAFKDKSASSDYQMFIVGVQTGASELTEKQRTITFNYVVNNYSQTYILVYQFVLDISVY